MPHPHLGLGNPLSSKTWSSSRLREEYFASLLWHWQNFLSILVASAVTHPHTHQDFSHSLLSRACRKKSIFPWGHFPFVLNYRFLSENVLLQHFKSASLAILLRTRYAWVRWMLPTLFCPLRAFSSRKRTRMLLPYPNVSTGPRAW